MKTPAATRDELLSSRRAELIGRVSAEPGLTWQELMRVDALRRSPKLKD
jgi:hypothetical protein